MNTRHVLKGFSILMVIPLMGCNTNQNKIISTDDDIETVYVDPAQIEKEDGCFHTLDQLGYIKSTYDTALMFADGVTEMSNPTGNDIVFKDDKGVLLQVSSFEDFHDAKVCGTLDTDGLNEEQWSLEAEAFGSLDREVQSYLTNYDGDDSTIIECLERYDRVIYLHGEDYDFMGRIEAGKVTPKANSVNVISAISNNSNNLLVFVIASISLLTIAGFFFVYKKRTID